MGTTANIRRKTLPLAVILGVAGLTMGLGLFLKEPCPFEGRARTFCHTDVVERYEPEGMDRDRMPFLEACPPGFGGPCDEYPAVTMLAMRGAAAASDSRRGFFLATVALLGLCGLIATAALVRLTGNRALLFAASPVLMLHAFMNWDLIAVALAALATVAFVSRRDVLAGILLGAAAAAKFYPALILIGFLAQRASERDVKGALRLGAGTAGTALAIYLPFLVVAPERSLTFFRFSSERSPDFDSLWAIGCDRLGGAEFPACSLPLGLVNAGSLAAFAIGAWIVFRKARDRDPSFVRWMAPVALLPLFLLTNKVFSPQFALWVLPWLVLWVRNVWVWAALSLAEVAVFVTRFDWLSDFNAAIEADAPLPHGASVASFELALLVRAAILVAVVVAWTRRSAPPGLVHR